ncbi:hypothetical protein EON65_20920 [archaeon]|nr:MAG: hypothetical protein EON65_20920 [archaeon]
MFVDIVIVQKLNMMKNNPSDELIGVGCFLFSIFITVVMGGWQKTDEESIAFDRKGYDQLVGETPLIELKAISSLLKRKILAKVSYSYSNLILLEILPISYAV